VQAPFTTGAAIAGGHADTAPVYDILFKAAAETTLTIAADLKHLGAKVGITAVLHTWGSAMTDHPHIHMIVPGGGLSADGTRWIACRPGFFLPVRVLSRPAVINVGVRETGPSSALTPSAGYLRFAATLPLCRTHGRQELLHFRPQLLRLVRQLRRGRQHLTR
jgi:hypothetical protein